MFELTAFGNRELLFRFYLHLNQSLGENAND